MAKIVVIFSTSAGVAANCPTSPRDVRADCQFAELPSLCCTNSSHSCSWNCGECYDPWTHYCAPSNVDTALKRVCKKGEEVSGTTCIARKAYACVGDLQHPSALSPCGQCLVDKDGRIVPYGQHGRYSTNCPNQNCGCAEVPNPKDGTFDIAGCQASCGPKTYKCVNNKCVEAKHGGATEGTCLSFCGSSNSSIV